MLLRLLKEEKPEYLVMVFDSKEPSFRKKEYEQYKANRQVPRTI
jgi:DNA polymerase-1